MEYEINLLIELSFERVNKFERKSFTISFMNLLFLKGLIL